LIKNLTDENIDRVLLEDKAQYILFYSDDIPTKNQILEIFKEFDGRLKGKVDIYLCRILEQHKVASYFQMNTLPAVLFMKKGKVYGNLAGPASKSKYEDILKNALSSLIQEQDVLN